MGFLTHKEPNKELSRSSQSASTPMESNTTTKSRRHETNEAHVVITSNGNKAENNSQARIANGWGMSDGSVNIQSSDNETDNPQQAVANAEDMHMGNQERRPGGNPEA